MYIAVACSLFMVIRNDAQILNPIRLPSVLLCVAHVLGHAPNVVEFYLSTALHFQ